MGECLEILLSKLKRERGKYKHCVFIFKKQIKKKHKPFIKEIFKAIKTEPKIYKYAIIFEINEKIHPIKYNIIGHYLRQFINYDLTMIYSNSMLAINREGVEYRLKLIPFLKNFENTINNDKFYYNGIRTFIRNIPFDKIKNYLVRLNNPEILRFTFIRKQTMKWVLFESMPRYMMEFLEDFYNIKQLRWLNQKPSKTKKKYLLVKHINYYFSMLEYDSFHIVFNIYLLNYKDIDENFKVANIQPRHLWKVRHILHEFI